MQIVTPVTNNNSHPGYSHYRPAVVMCSSTQTQQNTSAGPDTKRYMKKWLKYMLPISDELDYLNTNRVTTLNTL